MMTQRTKDVLKRAAYWAALLFPAFGGAFSAARWVGAQKLDVSVYVSDRRADSLIHVGEQDRIKSIDHRTHVVLCRVVPTDTECP